MKENKEFPDLRYKSDAIFKSGREGYRNKSNNPYPKSTPSNRHDWFAGFLHEQRLAKRKSDQGNPAPIPA